MASLRESRIARSPLPVRLIRSEPHLYSATCRARLFYSRRVAGLREGELFRANARLFSMTTQERKHSEELRTQGFTVLPDFFETDLVDRLYQKADRLFRSLHVDSRDAYSVQNRQRSSLD